MKKTLIGVLPLVDPERNSFWMHPGYLHGIEQAGGLPVVLPMTMEEASLKQLVETMDGFLFTSGQDVSPELYGEAKGPHCGQCLPQRDEMEIKLLEMVLGAGQAHPGHLPGPPATERGHGREAVPTPVHGTSLRHRAFSVTAL